MHTPAEPREPVEVEPAAGTPADSARAALHMPLGIRSLALVVLTTLATIYMMREMRDLLVPIALSMLVYHSLAPFVQRLVRWRVPRALAAVLVMAAMTGGAGALTWSLSDEAAAVVEQLPEAARRLRSAVRGLQQQPGSSLTQQVQRAATELDSTAREAMGSAPPRGVVRVQIDEPVLRASDVLVGGARNASVLAGSALLVLVFALFLLISADRLKLVAVSAVGTLSRKKVTVLILDEIAQQMQRFLVVQILTSVLVAAATTAALSWLGLQHAAVWGLVAGVLNTLPYLGPLLATIGLAGVALVQFGTLSMVAWVAGSALVITSLEGFFLTPILQSRTTQMNKVAVFVGILFWSWMWGPVGLLLAVPLTMMVKVVCDHVEGFQGMGRVMGE